MDFSENILERSCWAMIGTGEEKEEKERHVRSMSIYTGAEPKPYHWSKTAWLGTASGPSQKVK